MNIKQLNMHLSLRYQIFDFLISYNHIHTSYIDLFNIIMANLVYKFFIKGIKLIKCIVKFDIPILFLLKFN